MSHSGLLRHHPFTTTAIQRAYYVGRAPEIPLGGMECIAYLEFSGGLINRQCLDQALKKISECVALRSIFIHADQLEITSAQYEGLTTYQANKCDEENDIKMFRHHMVTDCIDLDSGKCWAAKLIEWDDNTTTLCIAVSLAVLDLQGVRALVYQLAACYQGHELANEHTSVALWQHQLENTAENARQKKASLQAEIDSLAADVISTLPNPPQLPLTHYELGASETAVKRLSTCYSVKQWQQLEDAATGFHVSLASLLLALYARALRICSTDAAFMITVTGLYTRGSEETLAERTMTYAHRAYPAASFEQLVQQTHKDLRYRVLRGIDSSTELRAVMADHGKSHIGLSPYVFTCAPRCTLFSDDVEACFGHGRFYGQTPQTIIDCQVLRLNEQCIEVAFDVRQDAIDLGMAQNVFALFTDAIDDVLQGQAPSHSLPMHTLQWRANINSSSPACAPQALYARFRQHVEQSPLHTAVIAPALPVIDGVSVFCDPLQEDPHVALSLSYGELDYLARQLAAVLVAHVDEGDIVGIRLPKGPSQIVAVLGILYAGCAYLPVGLDMPTGRLGYIRQRSSMRYLVTVADFQQLKSVDPVPQPRELTAEKAEKLAYIIFTSGSTGLPKGVAISHRAAINTIVDINNRHDIGPEDALLAVSSLNFDLSVYDIFGPLSSGGRIITIRDDERRDAFRWAELASLYSITIWNSVPALVRMLLAATDSLPSIRAYLCSGDWIGLDLFDQIKKASPHAVLVAMGGSTEAAIWSNEYVVRQSSDIASEWPSIPYGLPLSGQKYRVMREVNDNPPVFDDCVDGKVGELWIGGVGLAAGYIGDNPLTNARFIVDQDEKGQSEFWYRTGDLGYWRDGLLFFVGRQDSQVKILGHRIECGEVEQRLKALSGIKDAIVVPIHNNQRLGAVLITDKSSSDQDITQQLAYDLPRYMIPSRFITREAFPLSANGKLDRRWAASQLEESLSPTSLSSDDSLAKDVSDPLVSACKTVWRQVLDVSDIKDSDNFFALGGDSLAATRVCALLAQHNVHATVGGLLSTATLRDFACQCDYVQTGIATRHADLCSAFDDKYIPLTPLQRAYALGADGIAGINKSDTVFSIILKISEGAVSDWLRRLNALIRATAALQLIRVDEALQRVPPAPVEAVTLPEGSDLKDYLAQIPLAAHHNLPLALVTVEGDVDHLGLAINYLALDALSLMRIVRQLIDPVDGYSEHADDIRALAAYALQTSSSEAPVSTQAWPSQEWLPPELPFNQASNTPARIASFVFYCDQAGRQQLENKARCQGITLSALILHAFSFAIGTVGKLADVTVTIPVCQRPVDVPWALGNFTQLRLCHCVTAATPHDTHNALMQAAAGLTPDECYIAAQGRAAYPLVFTSTVGLPEAEALYAHHHAANVLWTHTRTPGVVIDCQVLPNNTGGLDVRWDCATALIDKKWLVKLQDVFVQQLNAIDTSVWFEQCSVSDKGGSDNDAAVVGSGHDIALKAIAAALSYLDQVPEEWLPLVARWQQLPIYTNDIWSSGGRFLADCITGQCSVEALLRHPLLSPEQLLLATLRHVHGFDGIIECLEKYACQHHQDALQVLILGAGSGAFSTALLAEAAQSNFSLSLIEWEYSQVLTALAKREATSALSLNGTVDAVIAPASLHRDPRLLRLLPTLTMARNAPVIVIEVIKPDAAAHVAALLNPSVLEAVPSASDWWERLEKAGANIQQMYRLSDALVCIQAEMPAAMPPAIANNTTDDEDKTTPSILVSVAQSWEHVLTHTNDLAADDDFFTLGGDSLQATRIIAELRKQGFKVKLADIFNHPRLGDFSLFLAAQSDLVPSTAASSSLVDAPTAVPDNTYPLSALQQAYLVGRSSDQLLGGVAPHCYFEFTAPAEGLDRARFEAAIAHVVMQHDALHSRVIWRSNRAWGKADKIPHTVVEISSSVRACTEAEVPDPTQQYPLVVRISPDDSVIGIGMDNYMLDGVSMWWVMREIGNVYREQASFSAPPMTFAEYRCQQDRTSPCRDASFVEAMPAAPCLLYQQALERIDTPRFSRCGLDIDQPHWHAIKANAQHWQLTPAALLLGAYALALAEHTELGAFSINVTTFERDMTLPALSHLVGDFTYLGLVAFHPDQKYSDPIERLKAAGHEAQQGLLLMRDQPAQVSTLHVARHVVLQTGDPLAGLFPVVFTCGLGLESSPQRSDDFGFGSLVYARSQTPQVTLDFQVHDDVRGLHLTADYVSQLLTPTQVTSLLAAVQKQLERLLPVTATSLCSRDSVLRQRLAQVWRHYLSQEDNSVLGNFFQQGGDSLLAIRCVQDMQTQVSSEISLRLLLLHPFFDDFCSAVAQQVTENGTEAGTSAIDDMANFEEGAL